MNHVNRVNRNILLFAVLPVWLLLAILNGVIWKLLDEKHSSVLDGLVEKAAAEIDRRIGAEVARLRLLGSLHNIESILRSSERRFSSSVRQSGQEIWQDADQDHMLVREILDSSVGETFQRVRVSDELLNRVFLTDHHGTVIAASDRTSLFLYNEAPWWTVAQEMIGVPVSEGLSPERELGISIGLQPVGSDEQPVTAKGVLRAELSLEQLARDTDDDDEWAVLLVGEESWFVYGDESGTPPVAFDAIARRKKGGRSRGWARGMRFSARVLDAGVHWISPVWVSAARREAALPLSVYGPVGLIASVTILFAAMWLSFCRRHLWTYAFRPDPELIEAGDWILQKALRRKPLLVSGGRALPAQTTVRDELDAWVNGLRDSIGQEQSNQAAEIQRDLNLAKDFQQAYLDRPYPKIPAVHVEGRLRLNFYHRYEPASALGGDFYNIISFQDSAGVFIGDVMGHGTRSALITAIIRTLIDDLSSVGRNARHFLTEMNNQFCALLQNVPHPLFASAFYFVADTTARVCTFSSAGHPAPFHVRRSVGRITRLDVPAPRGAALGLMPKETYTGGYGRLEDGDVFIFFTDGVYEVHNSAGDEFGIGRMERVIQKLMYKPVAEIVDGIIEAIVEFAGEEPVADDICMIAVEVTTRAEQE